MPELPRPKWEAGASEEAESQRRNKQVTKRVIKPIPRELQPLVNRMTGWQRNQWARAGYPVDEVKRFTRLQHDRRELHGGQVLAR